MKLVLTRMQGAISKHQVAQQLERFMLPLFSHTHEIYEAFWEVECFDTVRNFVHESAQMKWLCKFHAYVQEC